MPHTGEIHPVEIVRLGTLVSDLQTHDAVFPAQRRQHVPGRPLQRAAQRRAEGLRLEHVAPAVPAVDIGTGGTARRRCVFLDIHVLAGCHRGEHCHGEHAGGEDDKQGAGRGDLLQLRVLDVVDGDAPGEGDGFPSAFEASRAVDRVVVQGELRQPQHRVVAEEQHQHRILVMVEQLVLAADRFAQHAGRKRNRDEKQQSERNDALHIGILPVRTSLKHAETAWRDRARFSPP